MQARHCIRSSYNLPRRLLMRRRRVDETQQRHRRCGLRGHLQDRLPTPVQTDRQADGLRSGSVSLGRTLDWGRDDVQPTRSVARRAEQLVALELGQVLLLCRDLACNNEDLLCIEWESVSAVVVHTLEQGLKHDLVGLVRVSVSSVQRFTSTPRQRYLTSVPCVISGRPHIDPRRLAMLPARR